MASIAGIPQDSRLATNRVSVRPPLRDAGLRLRAGIVKRRFAHAEKDKYRFDETVNGAGINDLLDFSSKPALREGRTDIKR